MFQALSQVLAPAAVERAVLVLNHMLAAEAAATERLRRHAGRCIRLQLRDWPQALPPLPPLAFAVTPAGLLEWPASGAAAPDLDVSLDASNPAKLAARMLTGERPVIDIQGDAALATDMHWLLENVRWDVEGDLARFVDPRLAHDIARVGSWLAGGLRSALRAGANLAARVRPPGSW